MKSTELEKFGIYTAYCIKKMMIDSWNVYTVGTTRAAQVFLHTGIVLFAGDDGRYKLSSIEPYWKFELLKELSQ